MVFNPYDNEDSKDDSKKAKLRTQAQEQFIQQLQQRIAAQSSKIEELQVEISKINQVIQSKELELEGYSKKVEEERMFFEQDKKARDDREYELKKMVQQKEIDLTEAQETSPSTSFTPPTPPIETSVSEVPELDLGPVNNYVDTLMAYYKRPTDDVFVTSLRDLVIHCSENGTPDQLILGILLKAEMPLTEDELKQKIRIEPQDITRAVFRLLQKNFIKKVGRGYAVISSEFAEMTDISKNWGGLTPEQVYENLLSVVYVESDKDELVQAFTKARDALMEMGVLATARRHEISQIIEKIKRHPFTNNELTETIKSWIES
ncbi:MAG: hypothetical protein HeimAB125_13190 [Candidatus Heimdallarchaeota archaeon AB_125]|nr:MAG: hypothetical protein HeimAB125_13190 [Candidatus Heimdallarchaeota archaeon AB_125]